MLHVKRIDTVFVPVTDIQKSEEWYLRMFPFRVVYRSADGEYVGFRFDSPGPLQAGLTIYRCRDVAPSKHLAFNFYTEDVDAAHSFLKSQEVKVTDIHGAAGMRFFDMWDPDGNLLGIVTFPESN